MKKNLLLTLPLLLSSVLMVSCNTGDSPVSSIPSSPSDTTTSETPIDVDPIYINDTLEALRNGVTIQGELAVTRSYFTDPEYQIPDTTVETETVYYEFDLNYENSETVEGADRRYYKVDKDEQGTTVGRSYYYGENTYNDNGYATMVFLDYNNEVTEVAAVDSEGDYIPYGSNGLLNPFTLLTRNDFVQVEEGFILSPTKASLLFSTLCSQITDDYLSNVTFSTRLFDFDGTTLTSARLISNDMELSYATTVGNAENPYHTAYVRYNYELDLSFSNIGTAVSKSLIKAEEEKEENLPLKNALANMVEKEEVTLTRELIPYMDDEYVGYNIYLAMYYMGEDEGIYSQAYSLEEGQTPPTAPSASDYLLKSLTTGGRLRTYLLNSVSNQFYMSSAGYSNLDNLFTYDEAKYDLSYLNANIFTLNDDGTYSPNLDNIPYIAREIIMSSFDSFTPIDAGYVTDVKFYVAEDQSQIEKVEVTYEDHVGNSGTCNFYYTDLGDSHPSFDIVFAS